MQIWDEINTAIYHRISQDHLSQLPMVIALAIFIFVLVIIGINHGKLGQQKDLEFTSSVSHLLSKFPEVWQQYQDWLREIVASRSVLQQRYPAWQGTLIFRWRLLYFILYVGGVIVVTRLQQTLQSFSVARVAGKVSRLSERQSVTELTGINRYRYILQRTATLLAVAELTLCGVAALTGILLAFYYQPTAPGAYQSLSMITHEVTNGTLILSVHHIAGNGLIVLGLVQIVVMFLGREWLLPWLSAWISGLFLTLTAIGLGWTAIVLNWEQTSFWRFRVELSIVAAIPWVGPGLRDVLSGGSGISSITLQHMYTLHSYVLAIAALLLSTLHLTALICQEQNWKPKEMRLSLAKLFNESIPKKKSSSV